MTAQRLPLRYQAIVWVWAALMLTAIFVQGRHAQIDRHVTSRLRFHAIPVALSFMYHGRAHDYTAFMSIAGPFQLSTITVDQAIAYVIPRPPPADDPTYYWAADDRGMADYVIAAFALFGPAVASLYLFYFVVLGASVVLFLEDLGWHPLAAALLIFALGAVYTCTLVIPLGNLTLPIFEPGSLYEPRLIELLCFVATLHLALTPFIDAPWTPQRRAIVAGQAAILVLGYHARSTVAWEFAFVAMSAAACWVWRRRSEPRVAASSMPRMVLTGGWPMFCLLVGFSLLKAYQHTAYDPRYFRDMGARTIWHNALMGFWLNDHLSEKYRLRVDDRVVVSAVRNYLRASNDPRLGPEWEDTNVMMSLGGHSVFNWFAYEESAGEFYRHIWRTDTQAMLHLYLVDKPREIVRVVSKSTHPDPSLLQEVDDLGFRPFGLTALFLIAPGVLLLSRYGAPFMALAAAGLVLFGCSILPGLLFYPVVHTMLGAFATIALMGHVLLAWGVSMALRRVHRPSRS